MKEKIKQTISDYKVTYTVLLLWAVFGSVEGILFDFLYGRSYETSMALDAIWRFLLLFATGCFLAETCFGQSRKRKLLTMGSCFLLSAVIVFLGFVESVGDSYEIRSFLTEKFTYEIRSFLTEKFTEEIFVRSKEWMAAYMILILCAALFVNYRKSGETFFRYMGKVVFRMAAVCAVTLMVLLAVSLMLLVMEASFQGRYSIWNVWRIFNICAAGFTVLAGGVYAMQGKEESAEGEENFWHSISAGMNNDGLSPKPFYRRVLNALPWLLAPLSVLQSISFGMRIAQSGLTRESYLGIMLVLFEVITLVMWLICRKHMEYLLVVVAGFTVIAVFVPMINMTSLCCMQQEFWLKTYSKQAMNGEELSGKEATRLEGAYQYLLKEKGHDYVWEKYGSAESLQGIEDAEKSKDKHYRIHGCQMVGDLNVDGFCRMRMLVQDPAYTEQKEVWTYDCDIDVDFENFRFEIRETGEMMSLDISSIYDAALAYILENPDGTKESASEYLKGINCMETKDGSLFYLNHFDVSWSAEETEEGIVYRINNMQISGMLLEK